VYPNQKRIVPAFKKTECDKSHTIRRLNRKLAFGLCKGRFGILNQELECVAKDIKRAVILVTAAFTVHNFLIVVDDDTEIVPVLRTSNERFNTKEIVSAKARRRAGIGIDKIREILHRHILRIESEEIDESEDFGDYETESEDL
jgi:hypothetical protein